MDKKVYIFFADGFEEVEGLTVVDLMRRAGIEIVTVSIKDTREVTSSHSIALLTDKCFMDVDFSDGDMLVLPGGLGGTKRLAACEPLRELLKNFHNKGGKVAAVCAGPTVLADLGLLKGRRATAYPSCMDGLKDAIPSEEKVVVDGNVTTSRGLGTSIDFALSLIGQLLGEEKAKEVAASIVYA
ncbi:MAG: DJ-1/PfpI family protein [Eubacteriales bacterium]|nr:DJ-1/PfpI family protein [Eubacteriales bacterium]